MTGADIAQSTLGFTGRGVHVAVIDTGIDYDHPDLGGCFGPRLPRHQRLRLRRRRLRRRGDDPQLAAGAASRPVPRRLQRPRHPRRRHHRRQRRASRASRPTSRSAPTASSAATAATSDDVILAALERVYRDGADVLNMSIGEALNAWPESPLAKAASRLVRKGIVVVAAAGNDRFDGLHAAGAPGRRRERHRHRLRRQRRALRARVRDLARRPARSSTGRQRLTADPARHVDARAHRDPTTPDDACAPLPAGSLDGKVALVRRGTLQLHRQGASTWPPPARSRSSSTTTPARRSERRRARRADPGRLHRPGGRRADRRAPRRGTGEPDLGHRGRCPSPTAGQLSCVLVRRASRPT